MKAKYYILVRTGNGYKDENIYDYQVNVWYGVNNLEKHYGIVAQTQEGWFDVFIKDEYTLAPRPWLFKSKDEAERQIDKFQKSGGGTLPLSKSG